MVDFVERKSSYVITHISNRIFNLMSDEIFDNNRGYTYTTDYEKSLSICKKGILIPKSVSHYEDIDKQKQALSTVGVDFCIPEAIMRENPQSISIHDLQTIDFRLIKLCDLYMHSEALYKRPELREAMKKVDKEAIVKNYNDLIEMARVIANCGLDVQFREMSDDGVYALDIEKLSNEAKIVITK
jgi:hypothetical protein